MRLPSPFPFPQRRGAYEDRRSIFGSARRGGGMSSAFKTRLILALVIALFAVISYYGKPGDLNEVTGETQRVALTEEADEVQLGLQAAQEMVGMHGGASRDFAAQQRVDRVGESLLAALDQDLAAQNRRNPYRDAFQFTLLSDRDTVNAFALPGGLIFITEGLFAALETEGQLAGVLGHEIGHVLSRHGNQQMAKQGLLQGLAGAFGVLGGDVQSARMAQMVGAVIGMKYGRDHELESDKWGIKLTTLAGYDPRAMVGLMNVLAAAGGGGGQPEFFSTHPSPDNRIEKIEEEIAKQFPQGLPPGLKE
jgi:predicted Zn-dependent protease